MPTTCWPTAVFKKGHPVVIAWRLARFLECAILVLVENKNGAKQSESDFV
jgi:hypothetical protein